MSPSLMTEQSKHSDSAGRPSMEERIRLHRERRAKAYGRNRNDVELDTDVQRSATEFQTEVQRALRDAS